VPFEPACRAGLSSLQLGRGHASSLSIISIHELRVGIRRECFFRVAFEKPTEPPSDHASLGEGLAMHRVVEPPLDHTADSLQVSERVVKPNARMPLRVPRPGLESDHKSGTPGGVTDGIDGQIAV